ncbi:hypothetical protein NECAME_12728 [Necator americanus]|uniref:Uncharacterized protein n=1 Tax=Necator americanus TaxID=51031 RepID=W2SZV6_NECAM|nr:hypothetical protein NECAME_12728 [Necator americanus]ETN74829.1 hypothetical protein NECAME_12728 [Necator americanus]
MLIMAAEKVFAVLFTIGGFLGSAFAFLVARSITKQANAREMSSIKPILVIYILKNFAELDITKSQQNYVVTYSSAVFQVSKFALYILTGQEFRDCLRNVIKDKNCSEQTVFVNQVSTVKANSSRR